MAVSIALREQTNNIVQQHIESYRIILESTVSSLATKKVS